MRGLTRTVERVYTGTEARALDRRAIDGFGIPGIRLMRRAGAAAFAALRERWPAACGITVVCGSGNNGGDGYVVAGLARDAGFEVQVVALADPGKLTGDAGTAYRFAECRVGPVALGWRDGRIAGDVVVDALLGTGARGEMRAGFQDAIDRINAAGKPVLALDVPSGVNADTGGLLTRKPIRADVTVTFVAVKLGLVTGEAVDAVGDIVFDDLDVPADVYENAGIAALDGGALSSLVRSPGAHKGDLGRLLIVGGEADMGGAVLLAGEAALRTGAGLVSIATRDVNRTAVLARRPELMVRATATPADIEDLLARATAVAVGPGLGQGEWGRELLAACARADKPLVVDADGLNVVAGLGVPLPAGTVITPHPGEAGRLLGETSAWIQAHRPQAVAKLSAHGKVAVLKGAGSLLAEDGELRAICLLGNAGMATAGSGDVLTGIVGALLARGLAPATAAELGVWLHARAGDDALARRRSSLVASDIIDALRLGR